MEPTLLVIHLAWFVFVFVKYPKVASILGAGIAIGIMVGIKEVSNFRGLTDSAMLSIAIFCAHISGLIAQFIAYKKARLAESS